MSTYDEKDLLSLIAGGDEKAFQELYSSYYPMVYAYVLKFVKVQVLAEDIVQDVFTKVWESRARLDNVRHFPAFILKVARNHTLNVLQSISHSHKAIATLVRQFREQREDDQVLADDYRAFVDRVLQRVPPRSRDIFRKCREQGQSYEEVAAEIGISRNAVKNHMVHTIRVLREAARKELDIRLEACILLISLLSFSAR